MHLLLEWRPDFKDLAKDMPTLFNAERLDLDDIDQKVRRH